MILKCPYKGGELAIHHSAPNTLLEYTKLCVIRPRMARAMQSLPDDDKAKLMLELRIILRPDISRSTLNLFMRTPSMVISKVGRSYIKFGIRCVNCAPDPLFAEYRRMFRLVIAKIEEFI